MPWNALLGVLILSAFLIFTGEIGYHTTRTSLGFHTRLVSSPNSCSLRNFPYSSFEYTMECVAGCSYPKRIPDLYCCCEMCFKACCDGLGCIHSILLSLL